MLRFYTIPESLYCAKTRILLRYKKLQWQEYPPPGGYGSNKYKSQVPTGNLPALVIGDLLLADSEAIAEYIEEQHPFPKALPTEIPIRAKVRELSRFHDTRLEATLRSLFVIFEGKTISESEQAKIEASINSLLQQLNEMLKTYLSIRPHHLCLADCGFAITFLWLEKISPYLGLSLTIPETVFQYKQLIHALPAIQAELKSYSPILESFLADELTTS